MKNFILAIALGAAVVSISVRAQDLPLVALAAQMPRAAVAAIGFRDEGKPKEFLTKALPEKGVTNNRTAREMHQIADDVYSFRELKGLTYFVYTQERFARELRGEGAPTRFEEVSASVLACQAKASEAEWTQLQACMVGRKDGNCLGAAKWQELIQCVTQTVRDFSPS